MNRGQSEREKPPPPAKSQSRRRDRRSGSEKLLRVLSGAAPSIKFSGASNPRAAAAEPRKYRVHTHTVLFGDDQVGVTRMKMHVFNNPAKQNSPTSGSSSPDVGVVVRRSSKSSGGPLP